MIFRIYVDLRVEGLLIFDKENETVFQVSEDIKDYKTLIHALSKNIDISEIESIKIFNKEVKGYIEFTKHSKINFNEYLNNNEDIILCLRIKEKNFQKKCETNFEEIIKLTNKLDTFSKKEASKNLSSERIKIAYVFSYPLVIKEKNSAISFNNQSNYDFEINMLKKLTNIHKNIIDFEVETINPEAFTKVLAKKPKILIVNSYGNYTNPNDLSLFVENTNGEEVPLQFNQFSENNFSSIELLILSNCHQCISERFLKLGIKNILIIQSFMNVKEKENINDLNFFYLFLNRLFSGKTISESYNTSIKDNKEPDYCAYHKHKTNCTLLNSMIQRNFTQIKKYIHKNNCCCKASDQFKKYVLFSEDDKKLFSESQISNSQNENILNLSYQSSWLASDQRELLQKIISDFKRIKIIYHKYGKGFHSLSNCLSKYLIERKKINRSIEISFPNRTITEHLIAKKIHQKLYLKQLDKVRDFYDKIKNEKILIILIFDKGQIQTEKNVTINQIFKSLIENTNLPKFIISKTVEKENETIEKENTFPSFSFKGLNQTNVLTLLQENIKDKKEELMKILKKDFFLSWIDGCSARVFLILRLFEILEYDYSKIDKLISSGYIFENFINNTFKDSKKHAFYFLFVLCVFKTVGIKSDKINIFLINKNIQKKLLEFKLIKEEGIYIVVWKKLLVEYYNILKIIDDDLMNCFIEGVIDYFFNLMENFFKKKYYHTEFDHYDPVNVIIKYLLSTKIKFFEKKEHFQEEEYNEEYLRKGEDILVRVFYENKKLISKKYEERKEKIQGLGTLIIYYFYSKKDITELQYWCEIFVDFFQEKNDFFFSRSFLLIKNLLIKGNNFSYEDIAVDNLLTIESINFLHVASESFYMIKTKENWINLFFRLIQIKNKSKFSIQFFDIHSNILLQKIINENIEIQTYGVSIIKTLKSSKEECLNFEILFLKMEFYLKIYNFQELNRIQEEIDKLLKDENNLSIEVYKERLKNFKILVQSENFYSIRILHSNPLIGINIHNFYSSSNFFSLFEKFKKYKKEINIEYKIFNKVNLLKLFQKQGRILTLKTEDFDENSICLENKNKESFNINFQSFLGILKKLNTISYDTIILAFPLKTNNTEIVKFLLEEKSVNHVIYFIFKKNITNFSIDLISSFFDTFIVKFISNIIKEKEVTESFEISKKKVFENNKFQLLSQSVTIELKNSKKNIKNYRNKLFFGKVHTNYPSDLIPRKNETFSNYHLYNTISIISKSKFINIYGYQKDEESLIFEIFNILIFKEYICFILKNENENFHELGNILETPEVVFLISSKYLEKISNESNLREYFEARFDSNYQRTIKVVCFTKTEILKEELRFEKYKWD